MRKLMLPLAAATAAVLLTLTVSSLTSSAATNSYAEDRAAVEDLQARYLFAMDFGDPDLYVTTFTEDGVLDIGNGEIRGRKAIHDVIAKIPNSRTTENGLRPASGRHNISNIALKVNGNKATGRAYWFHYSNTNPERKSVFDGYGHYEDELVKVNGQWLFSKRRIYNEGRAEWAYKGTGNPAW
ncbi:MAG TPA: nuclear transport factor 2 family protein [Vicinamibacterales bacterium]|nr:nuclear transport factor 2 family protein [Vicinamibacterales bacterium]